VRPQLLTLTGTLLHEGQARAFFGGTEASFRQVSAQGETVAGFRVVRISTSEVELETGEVRTILAVGKSLRRVGEGPWELTGERAGGEGGGPTRSTATASSRSSAAATAPAGDTDEIMKRLMERRRQEEAR
jgi:hypothetical protein